MDEVGGAIERVDVPDEIAVLVAVALAGFFGVDAMLGIGTQQGFDDGGLGGLVHFSHKVVRLLLRNAHRFDVERGAVDDGASGAGSLDGHVEHGMQVGRHVNCG